MRKDMLKAQIFFAVTARNKHPFSTILIFAKINIFERETDLNWSREMRRMSIRIPRFVPRKEEKITIARTTELIMSQVNEIKKIGSFCNNKIIFLKANFIAHSSDEMFERSVKVHISRLKHRSWPFRQDENFQPSVSHFRHFNHLAKTRPGINQQTAIRLGDLQEFLNKWSHLLIIIWLLNRLKYRRFNINNNL